LAKDNTLKAVINLAGKVDPSLKKAMQTAGSIAKGVGSGLKAVGVASAAAGAVIAAGIGIASKAIWDATAATMEFADKIDKMSIKTGLSYEELQKLGYVAEQCGASYEDIEKSSKAVTDKMQESVKAGSAAAELFKELSIATTDGSGNFRETADVYKEVIVALADMEDKTKRNMLAIDMFGKSGQELIPMLDLGSEGISDLAQRAEDLGILMSDETVKNAVTLGDTMMDVKKIFQSFGFDLAGEFIPLIQEFADMFIEKTPEIRAMLSGFIKNVAGGIKDLVPKFIDLAARIGPLIGQFIEFATGAGPPFFDMVMKIADEAILPLLPLVAELASEILPPLIDVGMTLINDVLMPLLPVVMQVIKQLLPPAIKLVKQVLNAIKPLLPPLMQLISAILPPLAKVLELVMSVLTPLIPPLTLIAETIIKFLISQFEALMQGLEKIAPVIENVAVIVADFLMAAFDELMPVIEFLSDIVNTILIAAFEGLGPILEGIGELVAGVQLFFEGIIDFIKNEFAGSWEGAWNSIVNVFSGIWDKLAGFAKPPLNAVIGIINKAIDGINSIKITMPDWSPVAAGQTLGFNISKLPTLAKGGFTAGPSIAGEEPGIVEAVIPIKYRNPQSIALANETSKLVGAGKGEGGGKGTYNFYITVNAGADKQENKRVVDDMVGKLRKLLNDLGIREEAMSFG